MLTCPVFDEVDVRSVPLQAVTARIEVQTVDPDAVPPGYQTEGAAGFDFRAVGRHCIPRGQTRLVPTGLRLRIPEGFEVQVRPRSGIALRTGLVMPNAPGTIDSDYRGEVQILLRNLGDEAYWVEPGDRIAQGVLSMVPRAEFVVVDDIPEAETERGGGGFGSTGTR